MYHGRQDSSNFEARTSVDHQSKESEEYGETRGDCNSYRGTENSGKPCSKTGCFRRGTVKKLIHQCETHPNRESMMADLDKNQKINLINEKSKELIRSMGNTEYFEMCEITSEVQCQDCLLYWEMGNVYCSCGTCLQPSQKNRKLNKDRCDVLSIPSCNKEGTVSWSSTRTN